MRVLVTRWRSLFLMYNLFILLVIYLIQLLMYTNSYTNVFHPLLIDPPVSYVIMDVIR